VPVYIYSTRPCFFDVVCMPGQEKALCDASRTGLLNVVMILLKHAVAHGSKVDAFLEFCLMPEAYMHRIYASSVCHATHMNESCDRARPCVRPRNTATGP